MILNENVETKPEWMTLKGKTLEGGYELGAVLETGDEAAHFRVRILGNSALPAYASFYVAEGAVASEQLQVWQDLRSLKHPNLKSPLASGRMRLNGVSTIYVICAMPDETLSEILGDRGLTDDEGRELLKCLGQGLLYLHSHGFAHGALSPEMAVAVGDFIQLSTECTRRLNSYPKVQVASPRYLAPEVKIANVSMAADIWCLGATVFEALVQKKFETSWFNDLDKLALGPTLRRCLDTNPQTRARLSELIDPPENLRDVATPLAPSARVKPVQVSRKPVGTTRIRPLDPSEMQLVKFDSSHEIAQLKSRAKSSGNGGLWRPILAAAAALVLIAVVIWLVILPKIQSIAEPPADKTPAARPAWQTKTLGEPETPVASTPQDASPQQEGQPSTTGANDPNSATWRVVLGSYAYEKDAERRIELLNKTHPDLGVTSLAQSSHGPYFVVAGGPMSQAEANELRKKALQMGISRASYVANFSK